MAFATNAVNVNPVVNGDGVENVGVAGAPIGLEVVLGMLAQVLARFSAAASAPMAHRL